MHAGRLLCHRSSVLVRPRLETDLDECTELARQVHDSDRYPIFLPSDLHSFMAAPDALAAWVAEDAGEIVGHVALRPWSSEVVMALAREVLGLPDGRLGVVARLLVSSRHRRRGIGSALLEVAAGEALGTGPVAGARRRRRPRRRRAPLREPRVAPRRPVDDVLGR